MALALHIQNCPLRSLYLSKNGITDAGVEALAKALPASKLEVLDLSSQFIGDKGAGALAKALLEGSQLSDLRLTGHNDVHLAGATSLAAALSRGVALKHLYLAINPPSKGALETLATALPKSQLISLEVRIPSVQCGEMAALARLGQVLNVLHLVVLCCADFIAIPFHVFTSPSSHSTCGSGKNCREANCKLCV